MLKLPVFLLLDTAHIQFGISWSCLGISPRERALGELPKHDHADIAVVGTESASNTWHRQTYKYDINDTTARSVPTGFRSGTAGNSDYHNNIAPVVSCYAWRRQA